MATDPSPENPSDEDVLPPEDAAADAADDPFPFTEDEIAEQFDRAFEGTDVRDSTDTEQDEAPAEESETVAPIDEEPEVAVEEASGDAPIPSPEPPPAPIDPDVFEFAGRKYLKGDVEATLDWVSNLSPADMAKIQEVLAAEEAGVAPVAPVLDPDEIIDPKLAEYVQATYGSLQSELDSLRAYQAEQAAVAQREQEARVQDALTEARQGTLEKFGLTNAELEALIQTTTQSGIVGFLSQQKGMSNPRAIFEEAFEQTYWMTPEFRERALNQSVEEATEAAATQARDIATKKARAGALTGGGAAAPRSAKPAPKTNEDKFNAMVDEIAQGMAQ